LERSDDGWRQSDTLHPSRGIIIDFDDDGRHSYGYHLLDTTAKIVDEEARLVQFASTLPDTPPDPQQFGVWVEQSVDRAVEADLTRLGTEVAVASACGSMYVTDSAFAARLLDARFGTSSDLTTDVASQVMKLELPVLQGLSLDDIMRVRANEGDAFATFRRELERQLAPLRLEQDPERLRIRLQNLVHELSVSQVAEARAKIFSLQRKLFVDAAVGVAGLIGTLFSSGYSLAATAVALANGARDVAEYRARRRENPGYFLWKAAILKKGDS
jgi:hypothetical protein